MDSFPLTQPSALKHQSKFTDQRLAVSGMFCLTVW